MTLHLSHPANLFWTIKDFPYMVALMIHYEGATLNVDGFDVTVTIE